MVRRICGRVMNNETTTEEVEMTEAERERESQRRNEVDGVKHTSLSSSSSSSRYLLVRV